MRNRPWAVAAVCLGALVVAFFVAMALRSQAAWEDACRRSGGTVNSHTDWTTTYDRDGNSHNNSNTTYYCINSDGRVTSIR
jgi:hypothetical protein